MFLEPARVAVGVQEPAKVAAGERSLLRGEPLRQWLGCALLEPLEVGAGMWIKRLLRWPHPLLLHATLQWHFASMAGLGFFR